MNLPELWFMKQHKETGAVFKDKFTDKNCPYWTEFAFKDLHRMAKKRINHWNAQLIDWRYTIIGWEINK
jgi:hypothetical protein